MEVQAVARFVRVSPSKVADLAKAVRGMSVQQALQAMQFSERKGAFHILKTLRSAVANAENNAKLSADDLRVKEIAVQRGPTLKRRRPRARGMVSPISKRTSHIKVVLADKAETPADEPARKE